MITVGLISDTHGLLRPEALEALDGVDLILHAGDVGKPEIVEQLGRLAPVYAVRGNIDHGDWLPLSQSVRVEETSILLLHDIADLPVTAGVDVVVFGHSHRPLVEIRNGVLFVNPGSAGPRRFKLSVTVGRLQVSGGSVSATIIELMQ